MPKGSQNNSVPATRIQTYRTGLLCHMAGPNLVSGDNNVARFTECPRSPASRPLSPCHAGPLLYLDGMLTPRVTIPQEYSILWSILCLLDKSGSRDAVNCRQKSLPLGLNIEVRFRPIVRTRHPIRKPPFARKQNNQTAINNEGACHGIYSSSGALEHRQAGRHTTAR